MGSCKTAVVAGTVAGTAAGEHSVGTAADAAKRVVDWARRLELADSLAAVGTAAGMAAVEQRAGTVAESEPRVIESQSTLQYCIAEFEWHQKPLGVEKQDQMEEGQVEEEEEGEPGIAGAEQAWWNRNTPVVVQVCIAGE